ncbi:MAG: hypothetical protein AAF546_12755, partial [Verrucomicrobiota bacterium]
MIPISSQLSFKYSSNFREKKNDLGGSIRKKDQPNGNTITKICDTLNRAIRIIGPGGLDTAPLYEYENNFDLY